MDSILQRYQTSDINLITCHTSNVSLDRLKLAKKNGGLRLRRITDVFSAAKAKLIMKSTLKENQKKYCYILLKEKLNEVHQKMPATNLVHPTASNKKHVNRSTIWSWFNQANQTYSKIKKKISYTPKIGEYVLQLTNNKIIKYNNSNSTLEVVPINYQMGGRISTDKKKKNLIVWNNKNIKITFEDYKEEKITMKTIFKLSIDKEEIPIWTRQQKKWLTQNVDLPKIFQTPLKSTTKIDDFRRKYFLNFWYRMKKHNCFLCNEPLTATHIISECQEVKKWHENIYNLDFKLIQNNPKDQLHTYAWICNWTNWKNYWESFFGKFKDPKSPKEQRRNFKKVLKDNEYCQLRLIKEIYINANQNKQTLKFSYYALEKGEIVESKQ